MCDYEISYFDYKENKRKECKCKHPSLRSEDRKGNKYCIFHSEGEVKKGFYQGFKKLYLEGDHNFAGFIFPMDFSFRKLWKDTGPLIFTDAVFTQALFLCAADFRDAEFSGEGGTDFFETKFFGEGLNNFNSARFSSECGTDFSWAQFSDVGRTSFVGAKFSGKGKVNFIGTLFSDETEISLRVVNFVSPENVTFDRVNLSRCRFSSTDLENVNIKEVLWKNKEKGRKWRLGRIKVYDDIFQSGMIFNRKGEKNHYRVYQLYNQLLLNYERTYRHHEAGDFFAGQMDMRRRGNLDRKIFSQVLLTLYKITSEYGERPVRVFGWLLFTLLFFGLIYTLIGIEGLSGASSIGSLSKYVKGLEFSLDIMTLGKVAIFKTGYILKNSDSPWVSLLKLIHVVSGASLLTLFLLSVRRRFRKV